MSSRPAACSGLMYAGDPTTVPVFVSEKLVAPPVSTLLIPKSRILPIKPPVEVRCMKMFAGLRSRCTIDC